MSGRVTIHSLSGAERRRRANAWKNRIKHRVAGVLVALIFIPLGAGATTALLTNRDDSRVFFKIICALLGLVFFGLGISVLFTLVCGKARFDSYGDGTRERPLPDGGVLLLPQIPPMMGFGMLTTLAVLLLTGAVAFAVTPLKDVADIAGRIIGFGICAGLGSFCAWKSFESSGALTAPRIALSLGRKARLGDDCEIRWNTSGGSHGFASFLVTLRCVEETVTGSGKRRRTETTDLWRRPVVCIHDTETAFAGSRTFHLAETLPYSDPETFNEGHVRKRVYWCLMVEARTPSDRPIETEHVFEVLPAGFSVE